MSMNSNNYAWYPDKTTKDNKHYVVALVQADNNWDLEKYKNYGDSGDPFPGIKDNRNFTSNSSPINTLYSINFPNFEVKNISNSGITMTCDFVINKLAATQENDTKPIENTQESTKDNNLTSQESDHANNKIGEVSSSSE